MVEDSKPTHQLEEDAVTWIWPTSGPGIYRGEEWPIVFCQVEGEEETGHIGSTGSSKVDSKSKFNMTEAKKIVSETAF